jgi:hypothetical protein
LTLVLTLALALVLAFAAGFFGLVAIGISSSLCPKN